MNEKFLNQNIDRLDVPCAVIDKLKENGITVIKQLCSKNKTYLKNLGLASIEINKLEVELQLLGLNLNSRY